MILLVVERRKKTKVGDEGKEAAKKKPRPRPVHPEHRSNGSTGPQAEGGTERQTLNGTPHPQNPAGSGPRAPLPGELYQRADRWWWRVKLPGEDKAKARPLKLNGEKAAAEDRETAEKIAFEMWEHAVEENAARQIKLESTEKIERLKAQFLDKVRHFTELVETANAKIDAEAVARAEAEAKLAQMAQAEGPPTEDARRETTPSASNPPLAVPSPSAAAQASSPWERVHVSPEQVERDERAVVSRQVAPGNNGEPTPGPSATGNAVAAGIDPQTPLETGVCECCGAAGIAMACLKRIDSGQSLCPRCLAALRADAARIESPAPPEQST